MSLEANALPELQNKETIDYVAKKLGLKWSTDPLKQIDFAFAYQAILRYQYADAMMSYAAKTSQKSDCISHVSISSGLYDRNGKELKLGDKFKYFKHEGYLLDDFIAEVVFENGAFCYKVIESNVNSYPTAFCEHDELKQDFLNWIEILH